MKQIKENVESKNLSNLISRVAETGERLVIEQQGKEIAAVIAYSDLQRLEALEAALLKKVELEEYEWLKAVATNPVFDFLKDPEEDIYTVADGKPFHDPEWNKTAASETNFISVLDPEEDIYTLADGKPFHDQG
ncbi:type II toxin-antitoxin system prevent-host-death family antitoxin [Kamptonema animale CS-326]|uniref:type II toxin-antitoxin system Phd/YefM family antitoxin n=1 Tax=Kamptonema animale TaxID=92934 RepID=UPI00232B108C|nr:type II toxin-antitoxin system prevent-host-death family antitoxin [Kamptonema animale]MDB9514584.1 type II toxin-antitoxin system prevent-host-death family antitoxin [Kamptonema animale CS-326]